MKISIILVVLNYSFVFSSVDWEKIHSNNVYIQPKNNVRTPIKSRIIGGNEAEPHSRPYQAAIIIDSSIFCGGTLISPLYVLTAAHCIKDRGYFQVILGAHNIRKTEPTQMVVSSITAIIHPDYNPNNFNNDVGLIRFPKAVAFNDYIQPIALAPEDSGNFETSRPYVSGWGRLSDSATEISSTLQEVRVMILANIFCVLFYDEDVIVNSTVCTSGVGVIGACGGDSGGPLVYQDMQIGIVSFSSASGCEKENPTGYARVSSFWRWITENTDLNKQ